MTTQKQTFKSYTIETASPVNIHSCTVYEYLKEIPYEIPVEIVATITKYYLPSPHSITSEGINETIKKSIPASCSFHNPIPTTSIPASSCVSPSLLNMQQFLLEFIVYSLVFLLIYLYYNLEMFLVVIFCFVPLCILLGAYFNHWKYYLKNDSGGIMSVPMSNVNERVSSLNNLFGTMPKIKFHINGYYISGYNSHRGTTTQRHIEFTKTVNIRTHCECIIEPNIDNESELYESFCYYVEWHTLLHFNNSVDRLKYQQKCIEFINNNIHSSKQSFWAEVSHNNYKPPICGIHRNVDRQYLIIINCRPNMCLVALRFVAIICTVFCISWLYKLPLYFLSKKKKLTITKYLSSMKT